MRVLLVLVAILLAAVPAAAERPRTGWSGQAGFSHYFPLSPEERAHLLAFQQAQRGGAFSGAVPSCGWAGCAQGLTGGGARGPQAAQAPKICGWAGCQRGGATQIPHIRTDVCGWAGCRGGSSVASTFAAGGGEAGFRDRCGWAGCR
jgi:hypothetical protein